MLQNSCWTLSRIQTLPIESRKLREKQPKINNNTILGNLKWPLEDVKVEWVAPHGTPGIIAVQVLTPNGLVRL